MTLTTQTFNARIGNSAANESEFVLGRSSFIQLLVVHRANANKTTLARNAVFAC